MLVERFGPGGAVGRPRPRSPPAPPRRGAVPRSRQTRAAAPRGAPAPHGPLPHRLVGGCTSSSHPRKFHWWI